MNTRNRSAVEILKGMIQRTEANANSLELQAIDMESQVAQMRVDAAMDKLQAAEFRRMLALYEGQK